MPQSLPQLAHALEHHRAGRLEKAEYSYQKILRQHPRHPDLLHLLGVVAHQRHDNKTAVRRIRMAIKINGNDPTYHCNLGVAYRDMGQLAQAADCYRAAVAMAPDYAGAHFNLAITLQAQGRRDEAVAAFRETLRIDPEFVGAYTNLGNMQLDDGDVANAIEVFRQAADLQPEFAEHHYNLGNALYENGQFKEAIECFQDAIQRDPRHAKAHNNLGTLLKDLDRLDEALEHFDEAIHIAPRYTEAHANRGSIHQLKHQFEQAIDCYNQALRLQPENADVLCLLGTTQRQLNQLDDAINSYEKALASDPMCAAAHFNLGIIDQSRRDFQQAKVRLSKTVEIDPDHSAAWAELGRLHLNDGEISDAITALEHAARLCPDDIKLHCELGDAYRTNGNYPAARACYIRAVRLDRNHATAWNSLGNAWNSERVVQRAITCFKQVLRIKPGSFEAHANLAEMFRNQGKLDLADDHFTRALEAKDSTRQRIQQAIMLPVVYQSKQELLQWRRRLSRNISRLLDDGCRHDAAKDYAPNLFYLAYQGYDDRHLAKKFNRLYRTSHVPRFCNRAGGERRTDRIRLGFVSMHLCDHTIGFLMQGLIERLPREVFHVSVLPHVLKTDDMAKAIYKSADQCVALTEELPLACRKLAEQNLDVVFYPDIGMDPLIYALAHSRFAPVQCVTWGHPVTTGMSTIDYFLSSDLIEPEGAEMHYSENLIRLKTLPTYYYRPPGIIDEVGRRHFGIDPDQTLYLCPQSLFKFHPDFDPLLAEILRRDPRGVLVMIGGVRDFWTQQLCSRFQRTIPDVISRMRFLPRQVPAQFLRLVALADVMLDPLHFGGGNTSYQALSYGVPIVTLPSPFMRGRVTAGMYRKMGVIDCIAETPEDYVDLAVRLGTDSGYRQHIRSKLLNHCSVCYEDDEAVNEISAFLQHAVEEAYSRL